MPIYEYTCEKCHKTTEALRKIADADEAMTCEYCGGTRTQRAHSVFAAVGGTGGNAAMQGGACPMMPAGGGGGGCCGGVCMH